MTDPSEERRADDAQAQQHVRELAAKAVELAGRADSPSAHPAYQYDKVSRAWQQLTLALIVLGARGDDLHDGIDRAMQTPVARWSQ